MDAILTTKNFEDLLAWMQGERDEEPEGAGAFISKLNQLYITKRLQGDQQATSPRPTGGRRLSLASIAADDYLKEIEKGKDAINKLNALPKDSAKKDDDDLPPADTGQNERERALALPRTEDGFIKMDINAVVLASAITGIWSGMNPELTKNRPASANIVMLAMYLCYGCCLAQRRTRLTDDGPQMWKYGVAFPKAYNKINTWKENAPENVNKLKAEHPEVAELAENILAHIAENGISKTSDKQRAKGTPWDTTHKTYGDLWSTIIPDKTIAEWFKDKLAQNQLF